MGVERTEPRAIGRATIPGTGGDRRDRSLLVLDGALHDPTLAALAEATSAQPFHYQDLGWAQLRPRRRASAHDEAVVARLWHQLADHVPAPADWFDQQHPAPPLEPPIDRWSWSGLDPLLRWYRDEIGAEFQPHVDEPWPPDPDRRSLLTLLVFLAVGGCGRRDGDGHRRW